MLTTLADITNRRMHSTRPSPLSIHKVSCISLLHSVNCSKNAVTYKNKCIIIMKPPNSRQQYVISWMIFENMPNSLRKICKIHLNYRGSYYRLQLFLRHEQKKVTKKFTGFTAFHGTEHFSQKVANFTECFIVMKS